MPVLYVLKFAFVLAKIFRYAANEDSWCLELWRHVHQHSESGFPMIFGGLANVGTKPADHKPLICLVRFGLVQGGDPA